jgi:hypothetical protein
MAEHIVRVTLLISRTLPTVRSNCMWVWPQTTIEAVTYAKTGADVLQVSSV